MDRQMLNDKGLRMAWLLENLDRPAIGPTYSDEHIESWAPVYLANPLLRLRGVPFDYFLAQPWAFLQYLGNPLRHAVTPGLRRAEAAIAEAERVEGHGENGRLVEKIRHHKHPRGAGRDFLPVRNA